MPQQPCRPHPRVGEWCAQIESTRWQPPELGAVTQLVGSDDQDEAASMIFWLPSFTALTTAS